MEFKAATLNERMKNIETTRISLEGKFASTQEEVAKLESAHSERQSIQPQKSQDPGLERQSVKPNMKLSDFLDQL